MAAISPFYFFLIASVVLLALELGIFQLSVFWFLFAALGAAVSAAVCWLFPETTWTAAIGLFAAATVLITAVLFPLLRRFQQQESSMAGNDAVGQRVVCQQAIAPGKSGKVVWSGRDWDAKLEAGSDTLLAVDEEAVICAVQGISLIVRRVSPAG